MSVKLLVALVAGCVVSNSFAALPTDAVALNVAFASPVADATIDCAPAVVPSVHDVSAATPSAFVVTTPFAGETLPLPVAGVKVTVTPTIGLPNPSVTLTAGAVATAVFTVATCPVPA